MTPDITALIEDVRQEEVVVVFERLDGRSRRPVDVTVAWGCDVVSYPPGEQRQLACDIDDAARGTGEGCRGGFPNLVVVGTYEFLAGQQPRGGAPPAAGGAMALRIRDAVRVDHSDRVPNDRFTPPTAAAAPAWRCVRGKGEFTETVRRLRAAISRPGGPREVIASLALATDTEVDPLDVYLAMRVINPSPHMFAVKVSDFALVGCSPLPLLSLSGDEAVATTDAGTRRRDGSDESWVPTAKETDEHGRIVDALQDDMRAISRAGSVVVESTMEPRRFSHVSHLFATARSVLRDDVTAGEAFLRLAPHSAVVGYPRRPAMAAIRGTETADRGWYGGVIAAVGPGGVLDSAALLRCATFHDGRATMRSGAGIVADSQPDAEFDECLAKSEAVRAAVAAAESFGRAVP